MLGCEMAIAKLPLTASRYYSTNFRVLVSLNNKRLSRELEILNYDRLSENKQCLDEIRSLDWMALIDRYWLVINHWLTETDWADHLTCQWWSVSRKTPWDGLFNEGSYLTRSTICATAYRWQWVKLCHIFRELVMTTLVTFLCAWVFISFKTFMWMVIGDECLFQQPPYPLLL